MLSACKTTRPDRVDNVEIPEVYHTMYFDHQYMRVAHIEADCVCAYTLRNESFAIPLRQLSYDDPPIHIYLDGSSTKQDEVFIGGYGFSVFGIHAGPKLFCGPVGHERPTNNIIISVNYFVSFGLLSTF